MAKQRRTKALQKRAQILTMKEIRHGTLHPVTHVPFLTCEIGYPPTVSKADPHNTAPTVKALIDGMVHAGLWPDDNSTILPNVNFARAKQKSKPGTHTVTFLLIDQTLPF